jgi:NADH-quinone oxidoreductase subunit K
MRSKKHTTQMIITNINYILNTTILLFLIGSLGLVFNRKNVLITIMSIEIMLLAVNLNFVIFSIYLDDILGYIFVLFVLTIAATESAIGLAILSIYYKLKRTIQMDLIKSFKT